MDQELKLRKFSCLSMNQKLARIKEQNQECLNLFKSLYHFRNGDRSGQKKEQQSFRQEDNIIDSVNSQTEISIEQGKNQFLNTLLMKQAEILNQQKSIMHEKEFSLGVSQVFQRVTLKQQIKSTAQESENQVLNFQINFLNSKLKNKNVISSKSINIELNLNGIKPIQNNDRLSNNQKNGFSLSNFNSFNNNQVSHNNDIKINKSILEQENLQYQNNFEYFLSEIQAKFNKKLSQKGIKKIIENIEKIKNDLQKQNKKEDKNIQIKSFSKVKVNALEQRKIDVNVNLDNNSNSTGNKKICSSKKKQQQKGYSTKQEQKGYSAVRRNIFLKDKQNNNNKSSQLIENQQKSVKISRTCGNRSKDTKGLMKKTLKIIRNNRSSHLQYCDNRDIQQYCIINKIFGKNKKMILWAIQNQRPIITLD